jgi:hypothetical protein
MLVQKSPEVKPANRFRTFITIQPRKFGFEAVEGQAETIVVDSHQPLTRQEVRKTHWEKRWTHNTIDCRTIAI